MEPVHERLAMVRGSVATEVTLDVPREERWFTVERVFRELVTVVRGGVRD